jgi:hypothetical protein
MFRGVYHPTRVQLIDQAINAKFDAHFLNQVRLHCSTYFVLGISANSLYLETREWVETRFQKFAVF